MTPIDLNQKEEDWLEQSIFNMKTAIQGIDWAKLACQDASNDAPDVRVPMAYAMFETLIRGVAADKMDHWCGFLTEALREVIYLETVKMETYKDASK